MENEINYPAPITPITPHQPYKAIGQEQDQGQFGNFGVQDSSEQNQDINPNEWSDTHNSQQVQSLSLEQQQAMQNQIMARTDAQVRRNEGLAQQQINDRLFASIETDSNAKAQELNSKINEIDNPKNLSEADLIANRGALLGQAQNAPDKYEKNYYTRHRNTGIGYIDKKEELSIADAYYIKKYIPNIDLSYKFLKHDITADVTMKNKGQATAIQKLKKSDVALSRYTSNGLQYLLYDAYNGNVPSWIKSMASKGTGRVFGDWGINGIEMALNENREIHTNTAHRSSDGLNKASRIFDSNYQLKAGSKVKFDEFKKGLDTIIADLNSNINASELAHLQPHEIAGYRARAQIGRELEELTYDEHIADPTKIIKLTQRLNGYLPAKVTQMQREQARKR